MKGPGRGNAPRLPDEGCELLIRASLVLGRAGADTLAVTYIPQFCTSFGTLLVWLVLR
jgi:hypothetical protein